MSGRLAVGDPVPSARQIAAEWGVALATAAKALTTLRVEGLVVSRSGAGTTVAAGRGMRPSARDHSISLRRTGRIYPPGHYARIQSSGLASASDEVAAALGLEPGSQAIRRHRITYDAQDAPLSASTSWFDASLAETCPLLLSTDRLRQGTLGYIEERTGRVATSGQDQISAGAADAGTAADLSIDKGSPVLVGRNCWIDSGGAVIEYGESISQAGTWINYEYAIRSEPE